MPSRTQSSARSNKQAASKNYRSRTTVSSGLKYYDGLIKKYNLKGKTVVPLTAAENYLNCLDELLTALQKYQNDNKAKLLQCHNIAKEYLTEITCDQMSKDEKTLITRYYRELSLISDCSKNISVMALKLLSLRDKTESFCKGTDEKNLILNDDNKKIQCLAEQHDVCIDIDTDSVIGNVKKTVTATEKCLKEVRNNENRLRIYHEWTNTFVNICGECKNNKQKDMICFLYEKAMEMLKQEYEISERKNSVSDRKHFQNVLAELNKLKDIVNNAYVNDANDFYTSIFFSTEKQEASLLKILNDALYNFSDAIGASYSGLVFWESKKFMNDCINDLYRFFIRFITEQFFKQSTESFGTISEKVIVSEYELFNSLDQNEYRDIVLYRHTCIEQVIKQQVYKGGYGLELI